MEEKNEKSSRKPKPIKGTFQIPEYIDWNTFNIKDINSSQVIIYIHDLEKDIQGDIKKINLLKSMPNLSSITINSNDFNVGIYLSEILKDVKVKKEFNLLDDFQNRDRKYIDASKLEAGTMLRTIPNAYVQWGAKKKNLNYGFKEIEEKSISRETIKESVEKLKQYGIKFEYPKVIPLNSVWATKKI